MKIELELKGYLPPSLNESRYSHWTRAHTQKKRAASALMSALCDAQREVSTRTTSEDQLKSSLIASAMLALLPMTPKRISRSMLAKRKLLAAKITKLSSLSNT